MEKNYNKSFELKDLDEILLMSESAKSQVRNCDDEVLKMERFINQYLETQTIDLEPAERMLFKIRAIKEQFAANIGIAAIPVSITLNSISSVLAIVSILLNFPSTTITMTQKNFIIIAAAFIIVGAGCVLVHLMCNFMKATKDRILIFKCAYLEHYLAGYIEKQKEQKKKADSADQSSQRKETQK